jgi:hypothetical protein
MDRLASTARSVMAIFAQATRRPRR